MVWNRRAVRWGSLALLLSACLIGVACVGGERDAPEWELLSYSGSSGGVTSSGGTSSGTGGSTSSGTGGSTSSGTGGSTSSGTGGAGGSAAVCDGSNDCGGCVTCALADSCTSAWDACMADVDCLTEAQCERDCGLTAGGDTATFNACIANCLPAGFDQVWPCFCSQACESDCAASAALHCTTFMPQP